MEMSRKATNINVDTIEPMSKEVPYKSTSIVTKGGKMRRTSLSRRESASVVTCEVDKDVKDKDLEKRAVDFAANLKTDEVWPPLIDFSTDVENEVTYTGEHHFIIKKPMMDCKGDSDSELGEEE